MFKFSNHRISPTQQLNVKMHLASLKKLESDVSSYAPGRRRFWLEHEGGLSNRIPFKPAVHDKRLWNWLCSLWHRELNSYPELGLACFGKIGIDLHRDASYADSQAMLINLGYCDWQFEMTRQNGEPDDLKNFKLSGGEIALFNCKHRHAALNCHENRWSIILWRISDKRREEFDEYCGI